MHMSRKQNRYNNILVLKSDSDIGELLQSSCLDLVFLCFLDIHVHVCQLRDLESEYKSSEGLSPDTLSRSKSHHNKAGNVYPVLKCEPPQGNNCDLNAYKCCHGYSSILLDHIYTLYTSLTEVHVLSVSEQTTD